MNDRRITPKLNIVYVTSAATISVMAYSGNRKIELPVEYANLSIEDQNKLDEKYAGKVLPLNSILDKWKSKLSAANFDGKFNRFDLIAMTSNGIFKWNDVKIYKSSMFEGREVYLVFPSNVLGEKYNRRQGVRINIDRVMDVEQDDFFYSVIVKDLSYCGVGIVEPLGAQINPEKSFTLHLTEETEDGQEALVGRFTGKIITQSNNDGGGIYSGCALSNNHAPFLQKYIANKQIEEIRRRNRTIG